jgi:hypothetical protein
MIQADETRDLPSSWNFPHERPTFLTTTAFVLELLRVITTHWAYALGLISLMVLAEVDVKVSVLAELEVMERPSQKLGLL